MGGTDLRGPHSLLVDALGEISGSLVGDYDPIELLLRIIGHIADELGVAEVGIMIVNSKGQLQLLGSTTERLHVLELFELQADEGPCPDCYHSGVPIFGENLARSDDRWPEFAPMARSLGFQAVCALPLRSRNNVVGAVNIFLDSTRSLTRSEIAVAQALGDLATVAITQHRSGEVVAQLQGALDGRIVIEQAKGLLAGQLGVDVDEAFAMMRSYSRDGNRLLRDVASQIVAGVVPVETVMAR